jgi:hypothetical protein
MFGAMNKIFRPYDLNRRPLLPPDLREWLPEGHAALFISDVVDVLVHWPSQFSEPVVGRRAIRARPYSSANRRPPVIQTC